MVSGSQYLRFVSLFVQIQRYEEKTLDAALFAPHCEKAPKGNLVRVSNDEGGFNELQSGRMAHSMLLLRLRDDFQPTTLPSEKMLALSSLRAERKMYVRERAKLKGVANDGTWLHTAQQRKRTDAQVERLSSLIGGIEKEMREITEADDEIKRSYDLAISVKGIGMVCALALICTTYNFTRIPTARKMARYIGTAPLEYQSGTSVRGKAKVSHMAAYEVKAELSQAAIAAIKCDPQIRQYYYRKRKEGKAAGCVLNAVKCKLLGRVYAVIKRGSKYVDICKYASKS